MFVDQFDSPKAFQLVVEALLDRGDQVASMALMLQWVSQVERTPLEDGDASFHPLALRWLRAVEDTSMRPASTNGRSWPSSSRFWKPAPRPTGKCPTFELATAARRPMPRGTASEPTRKTAWSDDDGRCRRAVSAPPTKT